MPKKKKQRGFASEHLSAIMPREFLQMDVNPLYMVMYNISCKQLFALMGSRMHENCLINQFDSTMTSFDLKVGFAQSLLQDENSLEQYYYYNLLAQLSSTANTSPHHRILQLQLYCIASWSEFLDSSYCEVVMRSCMLWATSLVYHIKTLDTTIAVSEQLHRVIESYFSLFQHLASEKGLSDQSFQEAKNSLLQNVLHDFFLLQSFASYAKQLFGTIHDRHCIQQYLEPRQSSFEKESWQNFLTNYEDTKLTTSWNVSEYHIVTMMSVQESYHETLFRYGGEHAMSFFRGIINFKNLHKQVKLLSSSQSSIEKIFEICDDTEYVREHFITSFKKMLMKSRDTSYNHSLEKQLQDFFEKVEEDAVVSLNSLPELLRKESQHMHMAMQYYLQYMLDSRVLIGANYHGDEVSHVVDTWYHAIYQPLGQEYGDEQQIRESIEHQYHANLAYHAFAYQHILAKVDKFTIPFFIQKAGFHRFDRLQCFKASLRSLLKSSSQPLFQIFASKKEQKSFQSAFQTTIQDLVAHDDSRILTAYFSCLPGSEKIGTLSASALFHFKQSFYCLDRMLYYDMSDCFGDIPALGCLRYSSLQLMLHGYLSQTILGVCILYYYLKHIQKFCDHHQLLQDIFHEIIVREIWCMPFMAFRHVSERYISMVESYKDLIEPLVREERTMHYCQIIIESLHALVSEKSKDKQITIGHEDIVRLRNCLIRIQEYSRKWYIPEIS